ncbi:hypothetical protein TNCV_2089911 [Trichonephila clavipes]|nr:hypothetical protein TNCV_2089911 [Trichonephila clavipes]
MSSEVQLQHTLLYQPLTVGKDSLPNSDLVHDENGICEQLSGGSVVVVHEEPHPQMTGTLSYRPEETGYRQREKSLDTRHRRLDDRYRVLPWPEDCTVVVCLHDALHGVYL